MRTYARLVLILILLCPVLTNCSASAQNKPEKPQVAQTLCVTPDEPAYTLIRECDWVTAPGFDPEVDRCRKESFKALLDNIVKLKAYKDRLLAVIDCLRVEKK